MRIRTSEKERRRDECIAVALENNHATREGFVEIGTIVAQAENHYADLRATGRLGYGEPPYLFGADAHRETRKSIGRLIKRGLPVVSSTMGVKLAESWDEVGEYRENLVRRSQEIQARIVDLDNFVTSPAGRPETSLAQIAVTKRGVVQA